MSGDAEIGFDALDRAFQAARGEYGEIGVPLQLFIAHALGIASRHLPGGVAECELATFCGTLHTADLYLAIGCALHNPAAWSRFTADYLDFIQSVASSLVGTTDEALEFADALIVDLFLPDRSGRSRIASYSGRSSLATWLRVLVCHRAINDRKKARPLQSIDSVPERQDDTAMERLEANLRSHRYSAAVEGSLREACCRLTERERLMLLMRYERRLKVGEIAVLLQVHPSNVTRQIERVCKLLRRRVLHTLNQKYQLTRGEIAECVRVIFENPSYSVFSLLQEQSAHAESLQRNLQL